MGLPVPECYVTRTNGSLTAAAQHLRARGLSAFAARTESQRFCEQQPWRKSVVAAPATAASIADSQRLKK